MCILNWRARLTLPSQTFQFSWSDEALRSIPTSNKPVDSLLFRVDTSMVLTDPVSPCHRTDPPVWTLKADRQKKTPKAAKRIYFNNLQQPAERLALVFSQSGSTVKLKRNVMYQHNAFKVHFQQITKYQTRNRGGPIRPAPLLWCVLCPLLDMASYWFGQEHFSTFQLKSSCSPQLPVLPPWFCGQTCFFCFLFEV